MAGRLARRRIALGAVVGVVLLVGAGIAIARSSGDRSPTAAPTSTTEAVRSARASTTTSSSTSTTTTTTALPPETTTVPAPTTATTAPATGPTCGSGGSCDVATAPSGPPPTTSVAPVTGWTLPGPTAVDQQYPCSIGGDGLAVAALRVQWSDGVTETAEAAGLGPGQHTVTGSRGTQANFVVTDTMNGRTCQYTGGVVPVGPA